MNFLPILADGAGYRGFLTDFNTTFWSAVLRITEAMVDAAPFLVAGVLAAGLLRGLVGAQRVRSLLGVGHWTGPFRAWALGVLLPICSLGALPVARELRRAGIPSGTVLSFVLVAPVLNPVSIVYGLSHIAPVMLLYFAVGTFVVSVGIGLIWNRVVSDKRDIDPEDLEQAPRRSIDRLAVMGSTTARSLVGPAAIDYGLALLAVGFLGAFLPHGVLQTGLTRDNVFAPVIMGLVAIPVYVTPTEVMMHFGHIVRDGYSLGAAFALIILGAGANVGVANWLRRDYGVKSLLLFVSLLIGATLAIGLTADRTIISGNATVADHTHAFDPFTRLAVVSAEQSHFGWVWSEVSRKITIDQICGLGLFLLLALVGIVLRILGDRVSIEHLMRKDEGEVATTANSRWNPRLTPLQLYFVGAVCSVALGVVGLFLYYPSTDDLFEDMNNIRVDAYDAVRDQDTRESRRRLEQLRSHAEKLTTSVLIRWQEPTPAQQESVEEVLYSLDTLEDYVVAGRFQEARTMITYVEKAYGYCRSEFRTTELN
ncbi:putative permease [Symmachiella dynata]|uniref:Putative permease n=1 Tax=Symmachiella dynata TaxID=2527995 RepID=A0A517ZQE9_9PLAN|nr:permease [Symmachiella dynata]QDU44726.1 putative permease [Symmachiella dynata]